MNPYYFIFEVEPQSGNPLGAHVSRAIVHVWVLSPDINDARTSTTQFFKTDLWGVLEEKDAYQATPEQIEALSPDDGASYRTAVSEGLHATFNYWHK